MIYKYIYSWNSLVISHFWLIITHATIFSYVICRCMIIASVGCIVFVSKIGSFFYSPLRPSRLHDRRHVKAILAKSKPSHKLNFQKDLDWNEYWKSKIIEKTYTFKLDAFGNICYILVQGQKYMSRWLGYPRLFDAIEREKHNCILHIYSSAYIHACH